MITGSIIHWLIYTATGELMQCYGVFFLCDWVTPVMGGHVTIRIVAWSDVNSVTGKYSLV